MSRSVTVAEAKAHISALLDKVEQGEEVIITRHSKPVARLVPTRVCMVERRPGDWGWAPGAYDPDSFMPMTEEETRKEGWP